MCIIFVEKQGGKKIEMWTFPSSMLRRYDAGSFVRTEKHKSWVMYRKKSHFSLWLFSLLLHSSARFIESFLKQLCPRALLIRGSLSALFNGVRRMKSALASKRGTRVIIFALINLQDFFSASSLLRLPHSLSFSVKWLTEARCRNERETKRKGDKESSLRGGARGEKRRRKNNFCTHLNNKNPIPVTAALLTSSLTSETFFFIELITEERE